MKWIFQLIAFVSLWISRSKVFIQKYLFLFWCLGTWIVSLFSLGGTFMIGYPVTLSLLSAFFFLIVFQQIVLTFAKEHLLPCVSFPADHIESLNENLRVLVAYPVVLSSLNDGIDAIEKLMEIRKLNSDPYIDYLLLADFQEALSFSTMTDHDLIYSLGKEVKKRSSQFSDSLIYIHCRRTGDPKRYSRHEDHFKPKVVNLLLNIISGKDVLDSLSYSSVEMTFFYNRYRYMIIADKNTHFPNDSILKMVTSMERPIFINRIIKNKPLFSVLLPALTQELHFQNTPFSRCFSLNCCSTTNVLGLSQNTLMLNIPDWFQNAENQSYCQDFSLTFQQICILGGYVLGVDNILNLLPPQTFESYLSKRFQEIHTVSCAFRMVFPWNRLRKSLSPNDRVFLWSALFTLFLPLLQFLTMTYAAITNRSILFLVAFFLPVFILPSPFSLRALAKKFFNLLFLPAEACLYPVLVLKETYQRIVKPPNTVRFKTLVRLSNKNPETTSLIYMLQFLSASLYSISIIFFDGAKLGLLAAVIWALFPFLLPHLDRSEQ